MERSKHKNKERKRLQVKEPSSILAQIAPVQTAPLLAWCKMASGLRILRVATLEKQSDLSCVVAKVQKPEKR